VGLVGVAGQRRERRQVGRLGRGVEPPDDALEAQDALQRLRAVADRRVGPAPELAFAEAHPPGDVLGARRRVTEQRRGLVDGGVTGAVRDQNPRQVEQHGGGRGGS
jgi:hypothetical protein